MLLCEEPAVPDCSACRLWLLMWQHTTLVDPQPWCAMKVRLLDWAKCAIEHARMEASHR